MTVFISIPWFLPAYKAGGPVQSVANLIHNFKEGIEYRIFCGDTDLHNEPLDNIESGKWVPFNDHTQVWYAAKEDISKTITAQIEALKPNVVFIIGLFSWHYNIVPLLFSKGHKKILSVRGMLHPGALSQKKIKKRLFLQAIKLTGMHKKIIFHATDNAEAAYIKKEFGQEVKVAVAGNFGRMMKREAVLFKEEGALKLISIALISPMKNYLPVLKALAACKGNIEYNIYGPVKDMEYWQLCLQQIKTLPTNIKATYHGELPPEKVGEALANHHVFILPSKSENFGHAIYEALSAGKPVITSHATPWNDLQAHQAGMNTDAAPGQITKAIDFFAAMDNEMYKKFAAGACVYAEEKLHKNKTVAQYRSMFFDKAE